MSTPPPPDIPANDWALTPPSVRLLIQSLSTHAQATDIRLALLQSRITDLEALLAKYSGNSSKPPSSDPPSAPPKPPKPKTDRTRGAQKGHAGSHRPLLPPEDISEFVVHRPSVCSGCHTTLPLDLAADAIERHQVWELPPSVPSSPNTSVSRSPVHPVTPRSVPTVLVMCQRERLVRM